MTPVEELDMRLPTLVRWGILSGGLCSLLTACADAPSASTGPVVYDAPSAAAPVSLLGDGVAVVTVDPKVNNVFNLADFKIRIPANTICDPSTTRYGTTEWEQPCTPATSPIVFTVVYSVINKHARLNVFPDVRFVPSVDPAQWVYMSLREPQIDETLKYNILWWNPLAGWVDESLTDPSVRTTVDKPFITRRVKHFSGYSVTAGRAEASGDDATDGTSMDGTPTGY
jgi:hypothetical protein